MNKLIYYITVLLLLTVCPLPVTAQKTIWAVRWSTDGNAQMRTEQTVTPGASCLQLGRTGDILRRLTDGVHTFNARFRDDEGYQLRCQAISPLNRLQQPAPDW